MNVIKHSFFSYTKLLKTFKRKFSFFNLIEEKDLSNIPIENIRNFSIIAHIYHVISTLSEIILEYCGEIQKLKKENQAILDYLYFENV